MNSYLGGVDKDHSSDTLQSDTTVGTAPVLDSAAGLTGRFTEIAIISQPVTNYRIIVTIRTFISDNIILIISRMLIGTVIGVIFDRSHR